MVVDFEFHDWVFFHCWWQTSQQPDGKWYCRAWTFAIPGTQYGGICHSTLETVAGTSLQILYVYGRNDRWKRIVEDYNISRLKWLNPAERWPSQTVPQSTQHESRVTQILCRSGDFNGCISNQLYLGKVGHEKTVDTLLSTILYVRYRVPSNDQGKVGFSLLDIQTR